jgi:hypothetical protein
MDIKILGREVKFRLFMFKVPDVRPWTILCSNRGPPEVKFEVEPKFGFN